MNLSDFLFCSVDSLRAGDLLPADKVLPMVDAARGQLEDQLDSLEENPMPAGLEALHEAMLEAAEIFLEALDYLELAIVDDISELADIISERTQDGLDVLRDVRQRSELHHQTLTEETAPRG